MATQTEIRTINAAALVQGVALVTFPAASTIFTSADGYALSSSQYGTMFVPQVVTAVAASLLGSGLSTRVGGKRVYLAGLAATACLGAGFGLTVPSLNTFTAAFHPGAVDQSVLVLNALLGLGTALAPLFVAIFVGLGFWVGLPLLVAFLLLILLVMSLRLPLETGTQPSVEPTPDLPGRGSRRQHGIPASFWVFAGFAVLYGFCETMNGNWSQLDLTANLGLSATLASLALTLFWAMVTAGRILFAAIQRWFPSRLAYHVLPFLLAVAFLLIASIPKNAPVPSIIAFALAGLGCSALLPLTISFGQEKLVGMSGAVAGGVIAFYQVGYGVAAFGVGPLRDAGISLPTIFAASAGVAAVMGALSFVVAHRRPSPRSLHPRPVPVGAPASS